MNWSSVTAMFSENYELYSAVVLPNEWLTFLYLVLRLRNEVKFQTLGEAITAAFAKPLKSSYFCCQTQSGGMSRVKKKFNFENNIYM